MTGRLKMADQKRADQVIDFSSDWPAIFRSISGLPFSASKNVTTCFFVAHVTRNHYTIGVVISGDIGLVISGRMTTNTNTD